MIPFVDLKTQYARYRNAIHERIEAVLEHGQYVMGPEIDELERELAKRAGTKHAVACSSGTDAIIMALLAHGVGPGDAVFTTPFTYVATVEAVLWTGATPVFVDIQRDTFNIDPTLLADAVRDVRAHNRLRARCLLPVDIFGQPVDYAAVRAVASENEMVLIADGAQSFGSSYAGKPTASWANTATTSFFPAKPLGCYGDGGAVFTHSDEIAAALRSIRVHGGGGSKYHSVRLGLNGRLDTLQAAILLAKLPSFEHEIAARGRLADRYDGLLNECVTVPYRMPNAISAWAQYSVLSEDRDRIRSRLHGANIPTAVYYEIPMHLQPAFAHLGYKSGDFPIAEWVSKRIVSLPMHPFLDDASVDTIAKAVAGPVTSPDSSGPGGSHSSPNEE